MRIHARTDLYVKALILMGFGTLAVTGALVDSRPDLTLPEVPSPLLSSGAPSVFTEVSVPGLPAEVSDLSLTLGEPRATAPRPRPQVLLARMQEGSGRMPAPVAEPAVFSTVAATGISDLEFSEVVLSPAPRLDPATSSAEAVAESLIALNNQDDDTGFFSGMLRRTSASVGRTGASVSSSVSTSVGHAGSSLVGAFRFVSDTVKRAF